MKTIRAFAILGMLCGIFALVLTWATPHAQQFQNPCLNPQNTVQSVALTATGQLLSAGSGSILIYPCSATFVLGGTTPTAQFQEGTGVNCASATINRTGVITPTVGTPVNIGSFAHTVDSTKNFCITLGGTSPTIGGVFSFVQQ